MLLRLLLVPLLVVPVLSLLMLFVLLVASVLQAFVLLLLFYTSVVLLACVAAETNRFLLSFFSFFFISIFHFICIPFVVKSYKLALEDRPLVQRLSGTAAAAAASVCRHVLLQAYWGPCHT